MIWGIARVASHHDLLLIAPRNTLAEVEALAQRPERTAPKGNQRGMGEWGQSCHSKRGLTCEEDSH